VLVTEDVVGLLHFLEARGGLLIAGVAVGVVLAGQLAVGLADLVFGGLPLDAQHFVIVARHISFRRGRVWCLLHFTVPAVRRRARGRAARAESFVAVGPASVGTAERFSRRTRIKTRRGRQFTSEEHIPRQGHLAGGMAGHRRRCVLRSVPSSEFLEKKG